MSGIFPFKTGVPTNDIVLSIDPFGTVQGIDIILDALSNESLISNISRFENTILIPLGSSTVQSGLTYLLDTVADTFTIQLRRSNGHTWDVDKAVMIGQILHYIDNQTISHGDAVKAIIDSISSYTFANRLNPAAIFTTINVAGDVVLNYNAMVTDVTGGNAFAYTVEVFQNYIQFVLGFDISMFTFALIGTTFSVTAVNSANDYMVANKAMAIASASVTGTHGNICSFYHAILAGYQAIAVL